MQYQNEETLLQRRLCLQVNNILLQNIRLSIRHYCSHPCCFCIVFFSLSHIHVRCLVKTILSQGALCVMCLFQGMKQVKGPLAVRSSGCELVCMRYIMLLRHLNLMKKLASALEVSGPKKQGAMQMALVCHGIMFLAWCMFSS